MIAPAKRSGFEEVRKVEVLDTRLTAWTESEFQQAAIAIAASEAKIPRRTIQGCNKVLVQQISVVDAAKELGIFPGQITRAVHLFLPLRRR